MEQKKILQIKGLKAAYGQTMILWGVDMEVYSGTVTTVMGRNGVGKSTLLKTIMGLVKTLDGQILFDDGDLVPVPSFQRARLGVAYVPQGREIIPKLTVLENLKLGLQAHPDKQAYLPEEEIYALFPVLKDFRKRQGGNLSGGQQQQLAIARALVSRPKLLLLDEPTEGIQPSIAQEIGAVITRLASEQELAVLLVEQKIDFAEQITDHYYMMDRGKMVGEGRAADMELEELKAHIAL